MNPFGISGFDWLGRLIELIENKVNFGVHILYVNVKLFNTGISQLICISMYSYLYVCSYDGYLGMTPVVVFFFLNFNYKLQHLENLDLCIVII